MDTARIKSMASELAQETVALRHHLHAHPEISWQEVETTQLIASKLKEIGFTDIKVGVGGKPVGVVADLVGRKDGPCVALRADIDALNMTEEGDLSYKSTREGAAHMCGHDAHAAMLLSVAKILYSMKDGLPGRVRFIFQPAEEHGLNSGADAMVREGVLDGVSVVAGMHIWSYVESGRVQWRSGPVMASADVWEVTFRGKGGHGAMPHKAVDPTVMAANFILAMQTVVSREVDPLETAVFSVGKMISGDVVNVIPETAYLLGNVRTFNREVSDEIEKSVRRIADGVAEAYRGHAETTWTRVYPNPVVNDRMLAELFRDTAVAVVGADNVEESPMRMTSEDFSFYQTKVPGVLFFLGCGNEAKSTVAPHHSPRFNVDDDVLPTGISLMACFACAALEKLSAGK